MTSSCQSYSCTVPAKMARYVILASTLASLALSHPDAPLYPQNVVFASAPLTQQSAQPSPHFVTRTFSKGDFTLKNAGLSNPTLFVATQPNQINTAPSQTQQAAAAPQRVFQIVSQGARTQSVPRNFVTFTRTPSLQFAQSPAEPLQSVPRNFVAFTRDPNSQVVQSPAEPAQSVPHNFVSFTRNPPQQYFGSQTVVAPQTNEEPQNPAQQHFGLQNIFLPASRQQTGSLSASNTVPAQQPGVRTVTFFPPQQTSAQSNVQDDQRHTSAIPHFASQPPKPRTVLLARPVQAAVQEQPQLSSDTQKQPLVVSSSQFFTRNFGNSGAVTYFIQPLSARAGQTAPNLRSNDPET